MSSARDADENGSQHADIHSFSELYIKFQLMSILFFIEGGDNGSNSIAATYSNKAQVAMSVSIRENPF